MHAKYSDSSESSYKMLGEDNVSPNRVGGGKEPIHITSSSSVSLSVNGTLNDSLAVNYNNHMHRDVVNTIGVNFGECISLVSADTVQPLKEKERKFESDEAEKAEKAERHYHLRNMAFLIAGFCFNYTAYLALQALQSSLNSQGGVGDLSLASMFAGIMISSAFICPYVIRRFGERRILQVGSIAFGNLVAGNAVGNTIYLVASFFLFGLLSGAFFPAQFRYVSLTSKAYAAVTGQTLELVLTKFSGAFFTFFVATHFSGNLISSLILSPKATTEQSTLYKAVSSNYTFQNTSFIASPSAVSPGFIQGRANVSNVSSMDIAGTEWYYGDCPATSLNIKLAVDETSRLVLMGTFAGLITLGGLCFLSLKPVSRSQSENGRPSLALSSRNSLVPNCGINAPTLPLWKRLFAGSVFDTVRFVGNIKMRRLVPIMVTVGVLKSFIYDDFNHFFVAQCLGTYKVGYSMACYGATNALANFIMMKIAVRYGRVALVAWGCIAAIGMIIFTLIWHKQPNQAILFTLSSLWGMVDATWNPQLSALLGVLFRDDMEQAYANYNLYSSTGFCLSFIISTVSEGTYIAPFVKTGIITIGLPIGFFYYYKVEKEYAAIKHDAELLVARTSSAAISYDTDDTASLV